MMAQQNRLQLQRKESRMRVEFLEGRPELLLNLRRDTLTKFLPLPRLQQQQMLMKHRLIRVLQQALVRVAVGLQNVAKLLLELRGGLIANVREVGLEERDAEPVLLLAVELEDAPAQGNQLGIAEELGLLQNAKNNPTNPIMMR